MSLRALGLALLVLAAGARAASFEGLAPGAFVLPGAALAVAAPPHGEAGNVGLVAGRDAALLIDTGASWRQGEAVFAAAKAASPAPIAFAVVTHALPEFLFGATALQARGVQILAHRDTARLIAQRCAVCLERFRRAYGEEAMAGSRVPVPDLIVEHEHAVDLGGRSVRVLDFGWAATPGDLAVLDEANGLLFAGGLVVVGRLPAIRDANLQAWIAALDRIAGMPLHRVVPGHGPAVGMEAVGQMRAYLAALDAEVRRLYAAQAGLAEALEKGTLTRYAGWKGYPEVHRQNVQDLYLALERAELAGQAPAPGGGSR